MSGLRRDKVPNLVAIAGMRIGPGHGDPGVGFERLPEEAPGLGISGFPKAFFNVGEKKVGQDGDKEVGAGSVGRLMKDRTDPQIAFEGAEGVLHLRQCL